MADEACRLSSTKASGGAEAGCGGSAEGGHRSSTKAHGPAGSAQESSAAAACRAGSGAAAQEIISASAYHGPCPPAGWPLYTAASSTAPA